MAKVVSKLSIMVSANISAVNKAFQRVGASAKSLRSRLGKGGAAARGGGGVGGAAAGMMSGGMGLAMKAVPALAAIASVGMAIRKVSMEFSAATARIDQLAKVSAKLGMTTNALNGLRNAASKSGVASTTLDMAMQRMTRRVAEAAVGTGEAQAALKELGVDAVELSALSPDEAFLKITDALENVPNQADKLRLAFKLFDSEGAALVNTMNMGSDQIRAYMKESERLNGLLEGDAEQVEAFNDAADDMGKAFEGLWNEIAIFMIPVLLKFVEGLKEFAVAAKNAMRWITGREFDADTSGAEKKMEAKKLAARQKAEKERSRLEREQREKDAKKTLDDMRKRGQQIRESMATPFEKAQKKLADLAHLFKVGAIDAQTFGRATAAAQKELFAATAIKPTEAEAMRPAIAAAQKGTMAGFAAVLRGKEAARAAMEQRKRLLKEAERRRRLLEQIERNTLPANQAPVQSVSISP